ncbi:hypothetical protein KEM52_003068 [Ascosphaera acerosa]|nr:hypothetical protein KEM52_003068 [Ascosphaera acerosa]
MPAMRKGVSGHEGSVKVRDTSFGKVSVVQIARAASSHEACEEESDAAASGMAAAARD